MGKIELLSPAGSFEGLEAALGAGADAVYVGGSAFGARAYAKNFTQEELLRAIDLVHLHGKRLHLTVNTLFKNQELLEELYPYLLPFYREGLDAVLVQDFGALSYIRREFPDLPVHASTQMTVTGPWGMRFLESCGVRRIVAARELSLDEIRRMHEMSDLEIEVFVHGALCYSYSGQCLMSSVLGGRSGNRGRCAQPCRLPYKESGTGQKHKASSRRRNKEAPEEDFCPLSLKDMNTLELLPQIIDAGAVSLKIEGRMKQPEYTAGVTAMYRRYLDLLEEKGPEGYRVEPEDLAYVRGLFSRGGSCTGYYEMHNGPSMLAFTNDAKRQEVETAVTKPVRKVCGRLRMTAGKPLEMTVHTADGVTALYRGKDVQTAQKQPLDLERVRRQMEKLGGTAFAWQNLDIEMEGQVFVPMGELNEARRGALEALERQITDAYHREAEDHPVTKAPAGPEEHLPKEKETLEKKSGLRLTVSCEDGRTAGRLLEEPDLGGIYLPPHLMEEFLSKALSRGIGAYLMLPHVTREPLPEELIAKIRTWLSDGMEGILVRNLESLGQLESEGLIGRCITDSSLYTWNYEAEAFLRKRGLMGNTAPYELNRKELKARDNSGSEMPVYGYIPLMLSAQCVQKNLHGCTHSFARTSLADRYGKEFTAACVCEPWKGQNTAWQKDCYTIIYNSLPYALPTEAEEIKAMGFRSCRLSFTLESPEEAVRIFRQFAAAYLHGAEAVMLPSMTRGHYRRGAM